MTLFPRPGVAKINTPCPFRYPLVVKKSIKIASSLGLSGTGMTLVPLISYFELSDDSVSKFTSLVRARDLFPPVTTPGERLLFWRVTNKLFRLLTENDIFKQENNIILENFDFSNQLCRFVHASLNPFSNEISC